MQAMLGLLANILTLILCFFTIYKWKKNKVNILEGMGIKVKNNIIVEMIVGMGIGFIAMFGIYLVEYSMGLIKVESFNSININLIFLALEIAFYALLEEVMSRGLSLNGLMYIFKNKYIVVIITGIIFGVTHAANPGATTVSIISNALGGVMYCIAYLGSGSLWFSFALHFSWNFFQGPILGFPVSGIQIGGLITQTPILNNEFLNGGSYGPEGGVIGIIFRFVVIALLLLYFRVTTKNNRTEY